jgi:hypothetical protein
MYWWGLTRLAAPSERGLLFRNLRRSLPHFGAVVIVAAAVAAVVELAGRAAAPNVLIATSQSR